MLSPNPRTSDTIHSKLYFGRTVYVPSNRVFVISGSVEKNTTKVVSDQVQEWDLTTLTVKLRTKMEKGGRTSFGCYYHGRYIYLVGGNETNSMTSASCCRFDIYKYTWEQLPDLTCRRANPCTYVHNDVLFAIGGFEYNGYSQFALSTAETLDLNNIKAGWKNEPKLNNPMVPNSTLAPKACFYSIDISKWVASVPFEDQPNTSDDYKQVLLVGGWQNSALCKHIDLWNVEKMTVQQNWKGMQLKVGDMATKRIVINEDTKTVIVLGRKALHFIDLKTFETSYI